MLQGPYRECIEQMMAEVSTPALPMFVVCPNGANNMGGNRCVVVRVLHAPRSCELW